MDKIQGHFKSHIQIPKSVLEGFSTSKKIVNDKGFTETPNMIFAMDMEGNISEINIKDANTAFGYYEDVIESKVLPTFETAFGDVKSNIVRFIKDIDKNKSTQITLSDSDLIAIKKYCALCFVRSQNFAQNVQEKSIFGDLIANEPQNAVMYVYLNHPEIIDFLFANLNFFILKNQSEINLLLPQSGLTIRQNSTTNAISVFIPITDRICLMLSSVTNHEKLAAMDDNFVDKLNRYMIESEYGNNHKAIFAKQKSDLERYQDHLLSLKGN